MKLFIDISNYVTTRAHTGIQRVVREFLYHLITDNKSIEYAIIHYDTQNNLYIALDNTEVLSFLKDTQNYIFQNTSNTIAISDMGDTDIFYDMDGAWGHSLKRTYLYKELKKKKVYIVNFIYDLVPIVKPEFAHENTIVNFTTFIYAVYAYSDLVLLNSRSAEKDFLDIQKIIQSNRSINTRVIKLGSNIQSHLHTNTNKYPKLLNSKYILFVGTLEPRKNHALILEVFEKLHVSYPDLNLILIGKAGWNNDLLINKIKTHSLLNKKIFWLENINDRELFEFYENAYICTYLSAYEGFGLPIAESLAHNKITITSNNSSMYEVGKNFADYLTYNSFNELYEIIDIYLKNKDLYTKKSQFIKKNYTPYTWKLMYDSTVKVLSKIKNFKIITSPEKLQFVIISINKDNLLGTLKSIDTHIPFVKEYIIITSSNLVDEFKSLSSKHKIIIIDENVILGEYSIGFEKRDHVSKNWLLRASLLKLNNLDEQFVMLDDDNRPLKNISIDHFIGKGKYNAYYFYDLLAWNSFQTEYDIGEHNTKKVLDKDGYELLSYSSHKPQIIDKQIFQEVVDKYFEISLEVPISEWNIYFNYAVSTYPFLFNKIKHDTLNWPGNPSDWKQYYIPDRYNFENYYKTNFKGTFIDKVNHKDTTLRPYIKNDILEASSKLNYQAHNMAHGVIEFIHADKKVYIYSIPYFIKASKGSWVKLPLNYKTINLNNIKVELMYTINGDLGAFTQLITANDFEDNVIDFAISCTDLNPGEYDLFINVYIEDKSVYTEKSPYLVRLIVEE